MESTRARVVQLTRRISVLGVVLITFLLPLFFLPFTQEYFEFNKSVLFLGIMLVVLVSWLVNLAFTGTVSFWKTSFDNWILAVLGASVMATVFSQSKVTSLISFSGRLSESVIVLFFMVALTFIVRHVVTKTRVIDAIIWAVLASATVVAIITILQYFGVYIFSGIDRLDTTAVRSFSTIGTSNVVPFFFLAVFPVMLGFLVMNASKVGKAVLITLMMAVVLSGFVLTAGNFWTWPGIFLWLVLLGSAAILFFMFGKSARPSFKWLVVVGMVMTAMFLVRNVESVGNKVVRTDDLYVGQPTLQYDVAWQVAASSLSQSPVRGLFGSGPDTFAFSFTRFRPASYNGTENWNIRFTRSSSQLLETMGNIGVIGLLAWIVLDATVVIWMVRSFKENHESPYSIYLQSISVGIVVLMLSSVVSFFTINGWYLLWLFLGMVVAVRAVSNPRIADKIKLTLSLSRERISVEEHDILPYVMLVPAFLLFIVGMWGLVKIYRAEVSYQNGLYLLATSTEDDDAIEILTESMSHIASAISELNFRDNYHADYGVLAVNLLREYSAKAQEDEDNADQYKQIQSLLLSVCTESAQKATELVPINVRNWESRSYVFQELAKLTEGNYGDALLQSINQAISLDPVKPQLYQQKGVVLSLGGLDDQALDQLEIAVQLQPLYLPARYDLAMQYQKMGESDKAIEQLDFILEVLDKSGLKDSNSYDQVKEIRKSIEEGELTNGTEEPAEEVDLPEETDISPDEEYDFPESDEGAEEADTTGDETEGTEPDVNPD